MTETTLLILDGNSLINRAFYGLYGRRPLTAPDGTPTGALFAFMNMLLRYLDQVRPSHVAVAFDRPEPTMRHDLYDDYKGGRKPMPDDLVLQLPILKDLLDKMGIRRLEKAGFEADDILGTLARLGQNAGHEVHIVSGDKDVFQLVDDHITVIWPVTRQGQSELEIYDRDAVYRRYQLRPEQFVDFKAIMGDPSDNIPGVRGIGEKGAIELLSQYQDLDTIYSSLDQLRPAVTRKLEESRDMAYLSRDLARIRCDVPLEYALDDLRRQPGDPDALHQLLSHLDLRQLISRLDLTPAAAEPDGQPAPEDEQVESDLNQLVNDLADDNPETLISFHLDEAGAFYWTSDGHGVAVLPPDSLDAAWRKLAESGRRLICSDIKTLLRRHNLPVLPDVHDVLIAAHLLNQSDGRPDLVRVAQAVTGQAPMLPEQDGEWHQQDLMAAADAKDDRLSKNGQAAAELRSIHQIAVLQIPQIESRGIQTLSYEIEMPLAGILASMEQKGVAVDLALLDRLGGEMDQQLEQLEKEIHALTGETFNINSPKQLSEVLFGQLGLKPGKKRSGGTFSTDSDELDRLADEHPVIRRIIEFRQTAKLRSTYIEGLRKVIDPNDGRVHTTFNQMLTSTGRLSSTEPNLQNIPIRMAAGQKIRAAFITAPEFILLDADYSQIELRLLAHLSGDPAMLEAFRRGADIHTETACSLFGCQPDTVTSEQRAIAKTMNFSIVYGISDFGLARDLGVPIQTAHQLIHDYDQRYPRVRQWLNEQVELAHEKGYVETMFGRRRYLHELKSANRNVRQFGERAAMNAPVQGSAADLIKIAMVRVEQALRQQNLQAELILQVHDELMVEAPVAERDEAAALLQRCMESAVQLDVPLVAEVRSGASWADCH